MMTREQIQSLLDEAKVQQDRAVANANFTAGQVAALEQLLKIYDADETGMMEEAIHLNGAEVPEPA